MNPAEWEAVAEYFGNEFLDEGARHESYELLERMVTDAPRNSKGTPNTQAAVALFQPILRDLTDSQLAFLIVHSGFIPDHYDNDSSDETLYSKLVEVMVAEWGRRVGITTELPTAKASTEDVTFISGDLYVVVCDVKSYRLGRSQAAPNVKDLVKAEDFSKWSQQHRLREAVGGLVIFPSRFDFKKGSDVYLYASNPSPGKRILILFYEHLAYLLIHRAQLEPSSFFSILDNYGNLFAKASKNRHTYWNIVSSDIQRIANDSQLERFFDPCQTILDDLVASTIVRIEQRISNVKRSLEAELRGLSEEDLRERLLPSEFEHRCGEDAKRLVNIRKFRL